MTIADWKELAVALLGGGVIRDVFGRVWKTASRETEMAHDEAITQRMFQRADELETRLLARIDTLERINMEREAACRAEILRVQQEYEVRMGELRQQHVTELTKVHSDLGRCSERCSALEREVARLQKETK